MADAFGLPTRCQCPGGLHITRAALPHLIKAAESGPRQVADVITVSSIAGRQVHVGAAVYNLTKHGIGAFSESLRQELAERHVRGHIERLIADPITCLVTRPHRVVVNEIMIRPTDSAF